MNETSGSQASRSSAEALERIAQVLEVQVAAFYRSSDDFDGLGAERDADAICAELVAAFKALGDRKTQLLALSLVKDLAAP